LASPPSERANRLLYHQAWRHDEADALRQRIAAGWEELVAEREQLGLDEPDTQFARTRLAEVVVADPFYPSSKTCSACGLVKAELGLAERTFRCQRCGLIIDRDINAARSLLRLVAGVAGDPNARGGAVRPG
jgi:hypothetical protein